MATLKQLRLEARLSVNGLAKLAKVDHVTVDRAERGLPVLDVKAYAIVKALAEKLDRRITLQDVEGLQII